MVQGDGRGWVRDRVGFWQVLRAFGWGWCQNCGAAANNFFFFFFCRKGKATMSPCAGSGHGRWLPRETVAFLCAGSRSGVMAETDGGVRHGKSISLSPKLCNFQEGVDTGWRQGKTEQ